MAVGVADSAEPALRAELFFEVARSELGYGGDRHRAEHMFEASLQIDESLGHSVEISRAQSLLANVALDLGDRPTAAYRTARASRWLEPSKTVRLAPDYLARLPSTTSYVIRSEAMAGRSAEISSNKWRSPKK